MLSMILQESMVLLAAIKGDHQFAQSPFGRKTFRIKAFSDFRFWTKFPANQKIASSDQSPLPQISFGPKGFCLKNKR